mgnify:FL=1|tara:strand:- start:303 stop:740 length:438 start_codon:yes stop_codon:yes gene_type:complete
MTELVSNRKSGWNWTDWNGSERLLITSFIATIVSLLLAWRDIGILTKSGIETSEGWIALALVTYSAVTIIRGQQINKPLAIGLAIAAIAFGVINLASGFETIEADGFFILEDTTFDYNGIGAYLFVPIAIVNLIGAIKSRQSSDK